MYTILAADDEAELLDVLELYLDREHIGIRKAKDGIEAMEIFRREEVHLVLLDIMMPGLDGYAVLRKIREASRIPAIMLTAKSEDYDKILGLELHDHSLGFHAGIYQTGSFQKLAQLYKIIP